MLKEQVRVAIHRITTHPVSAIPSNSPSPLVTNAKNGGTLGKLNAFNKHCDGSV